MNHYKQVYCVLVAAFAALTNSSVPVKAAEFVPLGPDTFLAGISGDGSFAIGHRFRSNSERMRWIIRDEPLNLGGFPDGFSPGDMSFDGSVVVGQDNGSDGTGNEASCWTEAGGMQGLGALPGDTRSWAGDVSADGSIVVGSSDFIDFKAFRWTDGIGMIGLGTLPGHLGSQARGVSADGSVVAGVSNINDDFFRWEAFRWTEADGMQGIGALAGYTGSEAFAISADGLTVVGVSHSPQGVPGQAFRWTEAGGIVGLGDLLGGIFFSIAQAVSADGSIIVGHSYNSFDPATDHEAFIWDETNGMRPLDDVLSDADLDLTGWLLTGAHAISDDGNVIGGNGINPVGQEEAWIARLNTVPEPSALILAFLCFAGAVACRRRSKTVSVSRCTAVSAVFALTVTLIVVAPVQAKKPDNPGGGNGGGNGGGSGDSELELVELLPDGAVESRAWAINDAGIVVGWVDETAGFWDATAAEPTFSPLPGGAGGSAVDVNENSQIVGSADMSGPSIVTPTYWQNPQGEPIVLPLPGGFHGGTATGISRDGVIAGRLYGGAGDAAVAWRVTEDSVFGPIVLSTGDAFDVATIDMDVNRVVGRGPNLEATAWDLNLHPDGSFTIADSMVLIPEQSVANAITEAGDVTGHLVSWTPDSLPAGDAFVIRDGSFSLLSSGGPNKYGEGFDLNDTEVVGATGRRSAFLPNAATRWDSRNRPEGLSEGFFGDTWFSTDARGVNSLGDIVGGGIVGDSASGYHRAWLLRKPLTSLTAVSAVPEPSTLILAFLCFAGTVSYSHRPRHSKVAE